MSIYSIPTTNDPFYDQDVSLEGTEYNFEFRYNQRENAWYLTVSQPDGTELSAGIKIVCNQNLFRRTLWDTRMPPGVLVAFANTTDDSTPGLNDLGETSRVTLIYYTSDEFATS